MYTITQRPLTDTERQQLGEQASFKQFIRGADETINFIVFFILFAMLGALVGVLASLPFGGPDNNTRPLMLLLTSALAGGGGYVLYRILKALHGHQQESRDRAIIHDTAEIITITTTEAVQIEVDPELDEDMLPGYAVQMDEETVLLINDLLVAEKAEEKKFPNTNFTIVRLPESDYLLSFTCRGDYLPPSREIILREEDDWITQGIEIRRGTMELLPALLRIQNVGKE